MSRYEDEAGFTLVEVLVAMTLSLVVLSATLDAFAGFSRNSRAVSVKNDAQHDARLATDQLARELRNAISSGTPPAPLEVATSYDLMFQTQQGSAKARVRYCLDNSTPNRELLRKQTQVLPAAAGSTSACPGSGWDESVVVADRLVNRDQGQNRPVFVFSYSPTSSTNLTDVSGIQTSLFVNREPASTRNTAELTSAVRLRNTNRAPTAAFTVTPPQNGHVVLTSNSTDPEGENLTFEWSLNGAVIPGATRSRLDHQGLASGTTHTFKLRVTDPGGLSNETTQTVVIP